MDFNHIYQQNYRRCFLFVQSYIHHDLASEDIVAESLVKYWKLLSSGEAEVSDALLLTILKNKALDYLKHQAIHRNAVEKLAHVENRDLALRISTLEACDPEEIFSSEIRTILERTLSTLPRQTREIFEMSRFDNRSVKEIAETTGLTVKGVEYHISKSLKALRVALKDYLPFFYFIFG